MSTWKQAMRVAEAKAFATRQRWHVLGHRNVYGCWCYHAWDEHEGFFSREKKIPPRER